MLTFNVDNVFKIAVLGAAGYAFYLYKQAQSFVSDAIDEPSTAFWEWYYNTNEIPDWVQPFSFSMWNRDFFGATWIMRQDVKEAYSLHYSMVLSEVLDSNDILKEEYRGQIV